LRIAWLLLQIPRAVLAYFGAPAVSSNRQSFFLVSDGLGERLTSNHLAVANRPQVTEPKLDLCGAVAEPASHSEKGDDVVAVRDEPLGLNHQPVERGSLVLVEPPDLLATSVGPSVRLARVGFPLDIGVGDTK
jgi:hypothetical protein